MMNGRPAPTGPPPIPSPPAQVMELLHLRMKARPDSDLRRLLFSKFSLLLSFLEVDTSGTPHPSQQTASHRSATTGTDHARQRGASAHRNRGDGDVVADIGGRRLYFASPVAHLLAAVVDGDEVLMTSVSHEHLTQLAMAATRGR